MTTPAQWEHSYQDLGTLYTSTAQSERASKPEWMAWNDSLAESLSWPSVWAKSDEALNAFSGHGDLPGTKPSASVYAGHQFGQYNPQLGDGRAVLLGEWVLEDGQRYDIS